MNSSKQQIKIWGLLSMVLIASLSIWAGSRVLHARQNEAISTQPFNERVSIDYASDSGVVEVSGWA
ncbi:MAG: hypothetical protein AAFR22_08785, partial [Chloroflexota bacterium]